MDSERVSTIPIIIGISHRPGGVGEETDTIQYELSESGQASNREVNCPPDFDTALNINSVEIENGSISPSDIRSTEVPRPIPGWFRRIRDRVALFRPITSVNTHTSSRAERNNYAPVLEVVGRAEVEETNDASSRRISSFGENAFDIPVVTDSQLQDHTQVSTNVFSEDDSLDNASSEDLHNPSLTGGINLSYAHVTEGSSLTNISLLNEESVVPQTIGNSSVDAIDDANNNITETDPSGAGRTWHDWVNFLPSLRGPHSRGSTVAGTDNSFREPSHPNANDRNSRDYFRSRGQRVFSLFRQRGTRIMSALGVWESVADENSGNSSVNVNTDAAVDEGFEDDPTCPLILVIVGWFACFPLPWVLGALLYCITPIEYWRARAVGALCVVLAVLAVVYLSLKIYNIEIPLTDGVHFVDVQHHVGNQQLEWPRPSSGLLGKTDGAMSKNPIKWDFNLPATSLDGWLPVSGLDTEIELTKHYECTEQSFDGQRSGRVLGPKQIPLKRDAVYKRTILMSPAFFIKGFLKLSVFFAWGGIPSVTSQLDLSHWSVSQYSKSAFPPFNDMETVSVSDSRIPPGFLGVGLRCGDDFPQIGNFALLTNSTHAESKLGKWLLVSRASSGYDFHPQVSRALFLEKHRTCRIALVDTVSSITDFQIGFVDVKNICLHPLPYRLAVPLEAGASKLLEELLTWHQGHHRSIDNGVVSDKGLVIAACSEA